MEAGGAETFSDLVFTEREEGGDGVDAPAMKDVREFGGGTKGSNVEGAPEFLWIANEIDGQIGVGSLESEGGCGSDADAGGEVEFGEAIEEFRAPTVDGGGKIIGLEEREAAQVHGANAGRGGFDEGGGTVSRFEENFLGGCFLLRRTDAKDDFVATGFGLGGDEAGRDAEARGGGGNLGDGRFGRIVIHERDGNGAKIGFVAKKCLEREIGNDDGGEHSLLSDFDDALFACFEWSRRDLGEERFAAVIE